METKMSNLFIDKRQSDHGVDEWGHEGDDTLLGSRFDDKLKGAQGNDHIEGNGGSDQIMDITWVGFAPDFGNLFTLNRQIASSRLDISNFVAENLEVGAQGLGQAFFHGGNDTFSGGTGDDYLLGLEGNDKLDGGDGTDVLLGGSGNDTATGGAGDDIFGGGHGNDYLLGGAGSDLLNGNDDNDRLEGGAGGDILIGGGGEDTAIYDQSSAGINVNLRFGIAGLENPFGSEASGDTLDSIEDVEGSRFNDVITGSDVANDLFGGLGNDLLDGGKGADDLDGGAGLDTVSYLASSAGVTVQLDDASLHIHSLALGGDADGDVLTSIEDLSGSNFDDSLTGNSGFNLIHGNGGNDRIFGLGGIDHLVGDDGDDELAGGTDNDQLEGGSGNDGLYGGDGNDVLNGGAGADMIDGGDGIDLATFADNAHPVRVILGEPGTQGQATSTIPASRGRLTETDTLINIENVTGSAFSDGFAGNSAHNVIHGGLGNDAFAFSAGSDILDGDGGSDTLNLSNLSATAHVLLASSVSVDGTSGTTTLVEMENVIGTTADDFITGTTGDNRIAGGLGNDLLDGGKGADLLDGGSGLDTVSYSASNAAVTVVLDDADLHTLSEASSGDAAGDVLIAIENLSGSNFDDTLTGNSGANLIQGAGGNDRIFGLGGGDRLLGGAGDDLLNGGEGGDVIDGGDGADEATFADNAQSVNVVLGEPGTEGQARSTISSGVISFTETDTLISIENVTGSAFADSFTGNSAHNVIHGGLGDDTFFFTAGSDILDGDGGADTLNLGNLATGASVLLASSVSVKTFAGATTLIDMENVIGTTVDDLITGTAGDNSITGGLGNDRMTGNGGSDTFVFRSAAEMGATGSEPHDIITDFSAGDRIDLHLIDADLGSDGDQAFTFIGDSAFGGEAGELRAKLGNQGNMNLTVDIDGDGHADGRIQLDGVTSIDASSFVL
jgi:Ca2+-binding RTX toxin-like protein